MEFTFLFLILNLFTFICPNIASPKKDVKRAMSFLMDKKVTLVGENQTDVRIVEEWISTIPHKHWTFPICGIWRGREGLTYTYNMLHPFLERKEIALSAGVGKWKADIDVVLLSRPYPDHPAKVKFLQCPCSIKNDRNHTAIDLSRHDKKSLLDANNIPAANICVNGSVAYLTKGLKGSNSFYLYAFYSPTKNTTSSSRNRYPAKDKYIAIAHLISRELKNSPPIQLPEEVLEEEDTSPEELWPEESSEHELPPEE